MPDSENPEIYLNNRTEGKAALNSVILRRTHTEQMEERLRAPC